MIQSQSVASPSVDTSSISDNTDMVRQGPVWFESAEESHVFDPCLSDNSTSLIQSQSVASSSVDTSSISDNSDMVRQGNPVWFEVKEESQVFAPCLSGRRGKVQVQASTEG